MAKVHTYEICPGVIYEVPSHHRNQKRSRRGKKSQWTITEDQEMRCFKQSHGSGWLDPRIGWGLHVVKGLATYVGKDAANTTDLIVARFDDGNNKQRWHGCPADHRRGHQDIPAPRVIKAWMGQSFLRMQTIRKIGKGQPCSL